MTVGIMQPYFMPYIGYWQLMAMVDTYVVYDDAQYIKGGWIARNNILMNGNPYRFTITLNGASPNKLCNEIEIGDDFKKFRRTLQSCYSRAPFFQDVMSEMEKIFTYSDKTLGKFMLNSFNVILDYLGVETNFMLSSDLKKDDLLRGADKVKNICEVFGADNYVNAIGGKELYSKEDFLEHKINLKFLNTNKIEYKQFNNEFVPNLSIIDILMFNSVEQVNELLKQYVLE